MTDNQDIELLYGEDDSVIGARELVDAVTIALQSVVVPVEFCTAAQTLNAAEN